MSIRIGKIPVLAPVIVLVLLGALLSLFSQSAHAVSPVVVKGDSHAVNGCNIYRKTDYMVIYTRSSSQVNTPTNQYGFEAAVVDGVITKVENGIGGMAIPAGGLVISGHGVSRSWLAARAAVGVPASASCDDITPPPTPPPTTSSPPPSGALLPDLGIRTVTNVSLDTKTPGVRKLRFSTVTSNVGAGPLEILATRSDTSSEFAGKQKIYYSNGGTSTRDTAATFYFAGDGHNHWHVRDLDRFVLHSKADDAPLRYGEKHGFCFEDNTSYRDWPGRHAGSPANPVYVPPAACAKDQPNTLNVVEGLSVGWGDTYPYNLPDQYIDVTNLPNATYRIPTA